MDFNWKDALPSPPRDSQQTKLMLFGIGAGMLLGYNWDSLVSLNSWLCTTIREVVYETLFPEEIIPSAGEEPTKFIVGVGVVVRDGSRILIGRRLNSMGEGLFAVAGGRLDPGETFLQAGVRELLEETGLNVFGDVPLDCGAYIHPQTSSHAFEQFRVKTELTYQLEQSSPKTDQPIQSSSKFSSTALSGHPNPYNIRLAEPSVEVYCPDEKCQMIVRMVIVDKPADQEPKRMEDNKCENWYWVEWENIVKLAKYHDSVARYNHYQHLSPAHQAMILSTTKPLPLSKNDHLTSSTPTTTPPPYDSTHPLNLAQPTGLPVSYLLPEPPQFSPGCILRHTDQLFGPMQSLALTEFNPTSHSSSNQ